MNIEGGLSLVATSRYHTRYKIRNIHFPYYSFNYIMYIAEIIN